jgi:hypothetical protein
MLKPGEALRINEERASTLACKQSMGSYTFWAEYDPPSLSGEDREVLRANNISVPVQPIVSAKITFRRSTKRAWAPLLRASHKPSSGSGRNSEMAKSSGNPTFPGKNPIE